MKKLFSLLVLLSLMLATSVFAGPYDREVADEAGYVDIKTVTSDSAAIARPCYLYAISLYAGAAPSYVNVYNNASTGSGDAIEISEATQYDSVRYEFKKPVNMSNGAYVDITGSGSVVILEYR